MLKSMLSCLCGIFISVSLMGQTAGSLTVKTSTKSSGGNYAPRNVVAIWIEDGADHFVKSLLVFGDRRKTHLNNWQASTGEAGAEYNTVDAITGATKPSHGSRTCTWDGSNYKGEQMPDGSYTVKMELTDKNATGNVSSFSFVKGPESWDLFPEDASSFTSNSILWRPESSTDMESKSLKGIHLFQNPGNGIVYIDGDDIEEINVYAISGQHIAQSHTQQVDLGGKGLGTYVFRIKTKSAEIVRKFVKK